MFKLTVVEIQDIDLGEMKESLYMRVFDYLSAANEMPYGIQKARTGDPRQFVFDYLSDQLKKA